MTRLICTLAAFLSAAAMADAEADTRAVEEAFVKAANIADPNEAVKAVLANFADNAQHIGIFGRVKGKAEFEKVLPPHFAAPDRKNAILSHESLQLDDKTLVSITHFSHSFTLPDGKTMALKLRCTRTLQKQKDGQWRIVTEHTSVGAPPPPAPATR